MSLITQKEVEQAQRAIDAEAARKPLSAEQVGFVLASPAPTVLVAAAGSGKTRCLQEKLDREIVSRGVGARRPHVISFSNAAADNFEAEYARRRGVSDARPRGESKVATTLHSWCKVHFVPTEPRVSAILPRTLVLLRRRGERARKKLEGHLMLVDEAQDCTPMQLDILRRLQHLGVEVVLVGDPRQAIFGFTGASPRGMMSFSPHPASLPTNWRSTRAIIRAANALSTLRTGAPTGLEHLPLQTPRPDAPAGQRPTLRFCASLQSYHLGALQALLSQPRSEAACVVTYMNADVEKLHQNLSMLGVLTLPILANEDGETMPIEEDLRNGEQFVHVRTIHSVKGDQYGTVIAVVKGFDTPEEAAAEHTPAQAEEAQEELRRYYVALTRAKNELHVLIYGSCPPLWWEAVIRACKDAPTGDPPFDVVEKRPERRFSSAPAEQDPPKPLSIGELCRKHKAGDHLISLYRGANPGVDPGETSTGVVRAGALASGFEILPLDSHVDVRAPSQLSRLHVGALQRHVLTFFAQHRLAPGALAASVQHALVFLQQIPLTPWVRRLLVQIGRAPLRESAKAVLPGFRDQTFYPCFAKLLCAFIQKPGWETRDNLMNRFLIPQGKDAGLSAYDRDSVFRDLVDLVLLPKGEEAKDAKFGKNARFLVGPPQSVNVRHVVEMLAGVIDGTSVSPEETLFRERVTVLDSAALVRCRAELIQAGQDFLAGASTRAVLTRCALLVHLCTPGGLRDGRHRALPYLTSADAALCLRLEDMEPRQPVVDRLDASMDALYKRLQQHHTAAELALTTINVTVRQNMVAERIPRDLIGSVHWRVPGGPGGDTVGRLACGTATSLSEEAQALLAGSMAGAQRALLYEVKSGVLYTFDVSNPLASLESACAGLRNEDVNVEDPGEDGVDAESSDFVAAEDDTDEDEAAAPRSRSRTPPRAAAYRAWVATEPALPPAPDMASSTA